eukprot:Nitzschia sp. Nitz4//scaffold92_size79448//46843//56728//NITZ4_005396-RA/size79448-processed-gene-0.62-mRNA-1//-1//CDS//3329560201//5624//frame0
MSQDTAMPTHTTTSTEDTVPDSMPVRWTVCPKCRGQGKIRKSLNKRTKLKYQRESNSSTTTQSVPIRLEPCSTCDQSGLVQRTEKDSIAIAPKPIHVAIVGGGLAGLALGLACQHRSIPFTIFERDTHFHQRSQGYGLTMQQATRALRALGIASLPGGVTSTKHVVHTQDGTVVGEWGLRLWGREKKAPPKRQNVHIPRQALRQALLDALHPSPEELKWGHALMDIQPCPDNPSQLQMEFEKNASSSTTEAISERVTFSHPNLVVVGADGIRSRVRPSIHVDELCYLQCIVILGICPKDRFEDHVLSNPLMDGETVFQTADGTTRIYLMPFDTSAGYMWQLSVPMENEQQAKDLSQRGPAALQQQALEWLGKWHSPIPEIVRQTPTENISGYPVYDREILGLDEWNHRPHISMTLVGDAAHPMSPFKGQGANQALLDAVSLARSLYRKDSVVEALAEYHSEMLERSTPKVRASAEAARFLHIPASNQVPVNRSTIQRNETPLVPHPHAGARDALGAWGYVADVRAVKRSIEERYRVSHGLPAGHEVVMPRSFLIYHDQEQLDVACNLPPRNGLEKASGWDILNKTVQVGGPDPRADPNITLPYLSGKVADDRISTTRNPRILCAIYTHEKRHDMVTAVAETWGWKCDGFFAASTETVEYANELGFGAIDLPHLGKEEYPNMWQKTRSILSYMYDHYKDDFDFFFLSGDDTYLIVENLKKTLQWMGDVSWEWPLFLGQFFPSEKGGLFCGGGSGYLLNRKALEALVKQSFPTCEVETRSSSEDVWTVHLVTIVLTMSTASSAARSKRKRDGEGSAATARRSRDSREGVPSDEEAAATMGSSSTVEDTTTMTQPLHVEAEAPPDEDEQLLRDLIKHRTLLHSRIRLCREAAEKRLANTPSGGTDDQEIQAHKDMSKLASQSFKKTRENSSSATDSNEKRTSLSLRRGSGVGKRMNAALSSLAPGTANSSENLNGKSALKAPPVTTSSSSNKQQPQQQQTAPPQHPQSQLPHASAAGVSSLPLPTTQPKLPKPTDAPTQKARSFSKNAKLSSNMDSLSAVSAVNYATVPKVVVPKAVALREQRDYLENKLRAMNCSPQLPTATVLPQRRKTHWDRLLQEMTWLATDFIEERKWKHACGRTIARAVETREIPVAVPEKKPASETIPTTESPATVSKASTEKAPVEKDVPEVTRKEYPAPSEEDAQQCRQVAKLTSYSISELARAIRKDGCFGNTTQFHVDSLQRFQAARAKLLGQGQDQEPSLEPESMEVEEGSDDSAPAVDLTFEQISERIEELSDLGTSVRASKYTAFWKDLAPHTSAQKWALVENQRNLVEMVDRFWGLSPARGAHVVGPPSSGKTLAIACLLWKFRAEGPHLIVCSPARLLGWKLELERLAQWRVILAGLKCGIASPELDSEISPTVGDVVLCEYASVESLDKSQKWSAVVVDGRYPMSHLKSERDNVYPEILSTTWWDQVYGLVTDESVYRLIVEPDGEPWEPHGMGEKQQLEVLASRTAFVLGPHLFRSSQYSVQRTILSWARSVGKQPGEGKVDRVKRVFAERIEPFSHVQESPGLSSNTWQTQLCDLPPLQRLDYDQCCNQVRGALSCAPRNEFAQEAIAGALFRLRRVCFSGGLESPKPPKTGSSSQTDYQVAYDIVARSAKLLHLVAILNGECGYSIPLNDDWKALLKNVPMAKREKERKKVAILATMPEAVQNISNLLNCLGLRHVTIGGNSTASDSESSIELVRTQLALSAFHRSTAGEGMSSGPKILVAAADALAVWDGCLGVEVASVVISVDEDWSGRGRCAQNALVTRIGTRHGKKRNGVHLVRLVCSDTIEQELYPSSPTSDEESGEVAWPVDASGNYTIPENDDKAVQSLRQVREYRKELSFPASTILEQRDELLKEVLQSSKDLSPSFGVGEAALFIPIMSDSEDEAIELGLVRRLVEVEKGGSKSVGSTAMQRHQGNVLSRTDLTSVPVRWFLEQQSIQRETILPGSVLSGRTDMDVASSGGNRDENSEMVERWQETDPNAKRREDAESFLYYDLKKSALSQEQVSMASQSVYDGNQGAEPMVYFPPLFPHIKYQGSVDSFGGWPVAGSSLAKRKAPGQILQSDDVTTKRPRVDIATPTVANGSSGSTADGTLPENGLQDPEMGSLISDHDSDLDFGVLGSGDLLSPAESCFILGHEVSGGSRGTLSGADDFLSRALPGDNEESWFVGFGSPQLVSLFVRRPEHNVMRLTGPPSAARPASITQMTDQRTQTGTLPITAIAQNGEEGGKKLKKKPSSVSTSSMPPLDSAPARASMMLPPDMTNFNGKDGLKHRLLASFSSRQIATGLSMFESTSFRNANALVARRVKQRVDGHLWKILNHELGSGMPLQFTLPKSSMDVDDSSGTPSLVVPLRKGIAPGERARNMATSQRSALRRSLVAPCRVDFGPFQSGFLGSPSGMTGISPPRSRIGVSLPMGVKVFQSSREQQRGMWSDVEDKILRESVVRYGMNWTVVARAPFLVSDVRKSEKLFRDEGLKQIADSTSDMRESIRLSKKTGAADIAVLATPGDIKESTDIVVEGGGSDKGTDGTAVQNPASTTTKTRRTMSALKSAMTRRKVIPPLIPVTQTNQPVPSHASHMQAVQGSVAAQWSTGRTEMWPLQILDCADKHRAAVRASPQTRQGDMKQPVSQGTSIRRSQANGGVASNHHPAPTRVPVQTSGRDHHYQHPPADMSRNPAPSRSATSPPRRNTPYTESSRAYMPPQASLPPKSSKNAVAPVPVSTMAKAALAPESAPRAAATPISPPSVAKKPDKDMTAP